MGLLIHALRHFTYARHILHLPKANFTSAKQILHFRFAVGRLRVSAKALTEDALRPRAEFHSATEPPTLQFSQRVGLVTPSVKCFAFDSSLPEGGVGFADGGSNSSLLTPHSSLLTPNFSLCPHFFPKNICKAIDIYIAVVV